MGNNVSSRTKLKSHPSSRKSSEEDEKAKKGLKSENLMQNRKSDKLPIKGNSVDGATRPRTRSTSRTERKTAECVCCGDTRENDLKPCSSIASVEYCAENDNMRRSLIKKRPGSSEVQRKHLFRIPTTKSSEKLRFSPKLTFHKRPVTGNDGKFEMTDSGQYLNSTECSMARLIVPNCNSNGGRDATTRRQTFANERPVTIDVALLREQNNHRHKQKTSNNSNSDDEGWATPINQKKLPAARKLPIAPLLSTGQINLIRQHWNQVYASRGPTVMGLHVFNRACFKNPRIRDFFRSVPVPPNSPNSDAMFKSHAKSIGVMLDEIVQNLENVNSVSAPRLLEIGFQHAQWYKLGMKSNFFDIFAEAFIDCTMEWGEKVRRVEGARRAWAMIVSYITDCLKIGFIEGRRLSIHRSISANEAGTQQRPLKKVSRISSMD